MGQVASHISGYFRQPKQAQANEKKINNYEKLDHKYEKYKDIKGFASLSSLATPRQSLKRTRKEDPVSVPQTILDILSPPKRAKIHIDEFIDYPFINHLKTIDYYKKSKILIILRGLPGSGKSTIVKHLEKKYNSMKVCSADHFFMKDGEYVYDRGLIKDAHAECQRSAITAVQSQVHVVVIDNTNVKLWEMKFYVELADEFNYVPVIVEPQTPWNRDIPTLTSKNTHNLDEEIIKIKHDGFEEVLPIYFGWFLNEKDSMSLIEEAQIWIEDAYKIPEFRTEFEYFTETSTVEELIEYYKKPGRGRIVHITAKYIGKSLTSDNQKYIDSKELKSSIGKSFDVNVIGFVLTPRTLGARIQLTDEQLLLWAKDDYEDIPAEFWEVETLDKVTLNEDVSCEKEEQPAGEEAEISLNTTSSLNGSFLLANGNCELPSDSEHINHDEGSIEDLSSGDEEKQRSNQDGTENESHADSINLLVPKLSNGHDEDPKAEDQDVTMNEPKILKQVDRAENESPSHTQKKFSPSNFQRFNQRKGSSSPKKKGGVHIPDNDLNIDDSLTKDTWEASPSDFSANSRFAPLNGKGSRAHITLGCAPGVKAVTTGLDLILAVKKEGTGHTENDVNSSELDESVKDDQSHEFSVHKNKVPNGNSPTDTAPTFDVSGGCIRNYGNGVWVFYSDEVLVAQSVFTMVT